jgi:Secretory lipase
VNQLIMGTGGTPTAPLFIGQGALGELEGTSGDKPGIGEGDGVMIAGDVRSLAREYCERGDKVEYTQYPLGHVSAAVPWVTAAIPWLAARFAGSPPPENCASIEPGNPLTPIAE